MKKLYLKKELICPFDRCRTSYCHDKDGNEFYKEMGVGCEGCEYVWNRSTVIIERPYIDENNIEYKEYVMLHTSVCVEDI